MSQILALKRRDDPNSLVAAEADAEPLWWTPFACVVNELADEARPSPAIESEGWLATRSSLINAGERRVVDQNSGSWNRLTSWLRRVEALRAAA